MGEAEPALKGRVALVTGASRGVGRAAALALAASGADLVVCSTREGGTTATVAAVQALGRRALGLRCDVSAPADCSALVEAAERAFGQVDLLVNNAGTVQRERLEGVSDDDFDRVLRVNLSGPFYLCRRLIPGMVRRGYGRVVNVSSISSTLGTAGLASYCASKWGLNGLTKALAEEVAGTGVTVTALLPGSVDTDMLKGSGFAPKMGADDVARLIHYLCAQAPAAMNGSLVEMFG